MALKSRVRDDALLELEKVEARLSGWLEAVPQAARDAILAQECAQSALDKLATFRCLRLAQRAVHQAGQALDATEAAAAQLDAGDLDGAHAAHAQILIDIQNIRKDQEVHLRHRPGFLSELFRTEFSRRWNARDSEFDVQLKEARAREQQARSHIATIQEMAQGVSVARERLMSAQREAQQFQANALHSGITPADTEDALLKAHRDLDSDAQAKRQAVILGQTQVDRAEQQAKTLRETAARADKAVARALEIISNAPFDLEQLRRWDLHALDRTTLHSVAPYTFDELFHARREVFVAAMELHKAFIRGAWRKLSRTLSAFVNVLNGSLHPAQVKDGVSHLWDVFFLVVPVASTTFASFPRLFSGMGREALAWLLIDEAGQATPQQAVGAIWRARRSVIVGDPLQLEPVVPVPAELVPPLLKRCAAETHWAPPNASAQTLADRANRFGTYLGEEGSDEVVWLGSPLVVHRRCLAPMFEISNCLSYNEKMVFGTEKDPGGEGMGPSRWIDMSADTSDGHWIESQGRQALALVERITGGALRREGKFKVYVITPFRSVARGIGDLLYHRFGFESKGMSGTVHTFQGKEAEHVVFLLGGDPKKPGAIASFAGKKPNLVNVAVTRAKRRLYVIGDLDHWTGPGDIHRIYARMAEQLAVSTVPADG